MAVISPTQPITYVCPADGQIVGTGPYGKTFYCPEHGLKGMPSDYYATKPNQMVYVPKKGAFDRLVSFVIGGKCGMTMVCAHGHPIGPFKGKFEGKEKARVIAHYKKCDPKLLKSQMRKHR